MTNYLDLLNEDRYVEVTLDSDLYTSIKEHNPGMLLSATMRIQINLFKLMIAIGTIQTRSHQPTQLMKLNRANDLIYLIKSGSVFSINKTQDADWNGSISEDLGIGLSIMIAHHFFKLKWSMLGKIIRSNETKPDIKCMTSLIKELIIEAKGTTHNYYRERTQIPDSSGQKDNPNVQADIRVASCSLLKENLISNVHFSDPPVLSPNNPEYTKRLLMADHYSRVFNFIGQKELSVYFSLMKKRIINDTEFKEYPYKEELYGKIKQHYIEIVHENKHFLGNIDKTGEDNYLFTGVDKDLISLQGFLNFEDYNDKDFIQNNNKFHVLSDGICIGNITNLVPFNELMDVSAIKSYHEFTTIQDLDHMRGSLIIDFFSYIFNKLGVDTTYENNLNFRIDQIIKYKKTTYIIEYKKYVHINLDRVIDQTLNYSKKLNIPNVILITLSTVNKDSIPKNSNLIVIDRPLIKSIINNHSNILNYLQK